jgi:hypothetical protein
VRKRDLVALLVALILAGGAATAHHSFATYYFEERSVSIEGDVVEFAYSAPHAWVHLTASDATGVSRRFAAEWANPTRLARDGITADSIKLGDRVIITGSPGRNPAEYKIHLKAIERPADGWKWRQARRK